MDNREEKSKEGDRPSVDGVEAVGVAGVAEEAAGSSLAGCPLRAVFSSSSFLSFACVLARLASNFLTSSLILFSRIWFNSVAFFSSSLRFWASVTPRWIQKLLE